MLVAMGALGQGRGACRYAWLLAPLLACSGSGDGAGPDAGVADTGVGSGADGGAGGAGAGLDDDLPASCARDADCADDTFCNGREWCALGEARCVRGARCGAAQVCVEASAICREPCAVTEDADADGYARVHATGQAFCPDPVRLDAPYGGCPPGWTALSPGEPYDGTVDCCDLDARARPRAGGWFSSASACNAADFSCDGDDTRRPLVARCATLDQNDCQDPNTGPIGGGACFSAVAHQNGCGWDSGLNRCELRSTTQLPGAAADGTRSGVDS